MESKKDVDIIENGIGNLTEEEELNTKLPSTDGSFVAVDKEDATRKDGAAHHQLKENNKDTAESKRKADIDEAALSSANNAKIIKELKNIQRQNSITHYLLTAMIVLTLGWQLSEVSLILKIKNGLSNPFKSIGGIVKGFLRNGSEVNVQDMVKHGSDWQKQIMEPTCIPDLKIPELSHLGLPGIDCTSDDE